MLYDNFSVTDKDDQVKNVTNKNFAAEFVEKLKNYRLVEEEQTDVYVLQQKFAHNIVSMLSQNLQLKLKRPKHFEVQVSADNQDERAKKKWL